MTGVGEGVGSRGATSVAGAWVDVGCGVMVGRGVGSGIVAVGNGVRSTAALLHALMTNKKEASIDKKTLLMPVLNTAALYWVRKG